MKSEIQFWKSRLNAFNVKSNPSSNNRASDTNYIPPIKAKKSQAKITTVPNFLTKQKKLTSSLTKSEELIKDEAHAASDHSNLDYSYAPLSGLHPSVMTITLFGMIFILFLANNNIGGIAMLIILILFKKMDWV